MRKKEKEDLRSAIEDIMWMAVRYAHGRSTYAPSMVRDAFVKIKKVYPDFKLKPDATIEPPNENELGGMSFRNDYLDDLFTKDKTTKH